LMVVLGVMLLTLDRVKPTVAESLPAAGGPVLPATDGLAHGQA
jgi:hypothetical protein